ncbi:MAG: hypothetical protein JO126_04630 [Alphaproteobacteria bacterium]|nr:hypothetical protein [Alphaproteobacteria bacterium]
MKWFCLASLWLTACGVQQPAVLYHPVVADIPLRVACITPAIIPPDWPTAHLKPDTPLRQSIGVLLADIDRRKAYEAQLTAALAACR